MTIGLICAIPPELAHLRAALAHARTVEAAHVRFAQGAIDGHEVALVGAGIGKVNTALVATLLADRLGCRLIVFSGVAGGLDPALRIGDVVISMTGDRSVHDSRTQRPQLARLIGMHGARTDVETAIPLLVSQV